MPYAPHTETDIQEMLAAVGVSSLKDLFQEIPQILLNPDIEIEGPLAEEEVRDRVNAIGKANRTTKDYLSYLGGGAYERIRPSLVSQLINRSEFLTSYTPYQAEVSQGTLQFIFEFQSMICALTGMEVANASMYDGASAFAEAALMSMRVTRKRKILFAATIHPRWKRTLATYLVGTDAELVEIPERDGVLDFGFLKDSLDDTVSTFMVQHPNFFGYLEPLDRIKEELVNRNALWIQASDPVSLGLLSPPGDLGADIAVGELQSLGLPLSFGGPYAGYFACRSKQVRQAPGRIVGKTTDVEGKTGYVLTLQTREQHIRREKATSNICTNQSLCALAATIYLSCLGPRGLREVAQQNYDKTHYLAEGLLGISGIGSFSSRPFFNEFTLVLDRPATDVAGALKKRGILAGIHDERWTGEKHRLVVCVTETKKREDLDRTIEAFDEVL
jgi:glycine dehydrogenase subunit 1